MATEVKTYDPAKVSVSVGGLLLTGFEPGTFITIVRTVNNFDYSVGPDGVDGIRTKRNDRSALLTLTLRQASVSNLPLSNMAAQDEVTADAVYPISISDLADPDGNTVYEAGKCWVEKPADVNYAETPQGRAWQLRIADLPMRTGGTPGTAALDSTLVA